MKIIGLTGNTGSGKSHVCSILKDIGGLIIDADEISHNVILKGNPAYDEIINYFDTDILNSENEIDRKKLGAIVFSDKKQLDYLSSIIHKYVIKEVMRIISLEHKEEFIVIDAPLLIESGLNNVTDCIWLIHADLEKRKNRIMERDKLTEDEATKRILSQTSFEMLKPYATQVVYNNGSHKELVEKVMYLAKNFLDGKN